MSGAGALDGHTHDDGEHHHDETGHDHHVGNGHHRGALAVAAGILGRHDHTHDGGVDVELDASRRGMRALLASFAGLGLTSLIQGAVVALSGSVALLGDALHNLADALTAIPLAIAFTLGRRAATRRFTYGLGRAEDLAGLAIVALILASSAVAAVASTGRLVHPATVDRLPLVAVAALVGAAGNELVARYRIRVGREIGSAALVADGLHARTDALTSLAVLAGAGGVALGVDRADPAVGLLITVAILAVLVQAARQVFARLLDAVDPSLVARVEAVLRATPGVLDVGDVRVRWIGHAMRAECEIVVDADLSVVDAHGICEEAEHELLHGVRRLTSAIVHADPSPAGRPDEHHRLSAHHRPGVSAPSASPAPDPAPR
ncbi:MAG TPA: cation diffusion facilitator family transporter [Candidatus Dormibacteraeota bacterium]|nr:cation diffusion facilitator family transporter [Candidatus Dormibacteraeota bacterium]